jgi:hypothetical protein
MNQMPRCCDAPSHPCDHFDVERRWMPKTVRCLIVGENPGDVDSEYFYEPPADPKRDRVRVRRELLEGLTQVGLIAEPTLEAFRDAGFLFDHGIRCPLPSSVVKEERLKAQRYASERTAATAHLGPLLKQAPLVWVMGHVASNAVVNATPDFPKERRKISKPPYPGPAAPGARFFVSEYFHRFNKRETPAIFQAFAEFARSKGFWSP